MRETAAEISRLAEEIAGADAGSFGMGYEFADLDSMEFVELIQKVEERFGISVPSHAFAGIATLDDLARYVERHLC